MKKKKKSRSCFCREALKAAAKRHSAVAKPHKSNEDNMSSCRGRSHLQRQHQHQGHSGELSPDQKKQEKFAIVKITFSTGFDLWTSEIYSATQGKEEEHLWTHTETLEGNQDAENFQSNTKKDKNQTTANNFQHGEVGHLAVNRPINGVCQPLEGCSVSSNHLPSPS